MVDISKDIRKLIIEASYYAGYGHIPSALSIVEILLGIDTVKTEDDIFILSKGHGCLAYYAYLVQKNVISIEELRNFGKKDSKLGGHPDRNKIRDIYASTGSLGHGLPIAVGAAMAKKIMKKDGKVFCVIGDGEANEGTIWEAITVSVNNNLNNLICIVDNNNSQVRSLPSKNLVNKFRAFGCNVHEVNGHDYDELTKTLSIQDNKKPTVVVTNTVKGKGVSEMENDMFAWHHRAPSEDEYKRFVREIDES